MRILGMLLLTIVVVTCEEQQKPSDTSFISLEHNLADYAKAGLLIKKVHQQEWKIAYGFADNNHCNGKLTAEHVEQLKDQLTEVFKAWLKPLRELETNEKIVDAFSYIHLQVKEEKDNYGYDRKTLEKKGVDTRAMDLIIRCEEGRSYAKADFFEGNPTVVHMFEEPRLSERNSITDLHRYRLTTLLHEVGHAFGLADTYTEESSIRTSRLTMLSSNGFEDTVGNQPLSVMNSYYLFALDYSGKMDVTDDDKAGIEWLYKRYVTKTVIKLENCPDGYEHEESTNGCVPKYLFIHTARQGEISAILKLLKDDPDIDVNQQDQLGNTALHYAAKLQYRQSHGDALYLALQNICNTENVCSRTDIENNNGETAEQLYGINSTLAGFRQTINAALEQKNTLLASMLIEVARNKGHNDVIELLTHDNINITEHLQHQRTMLHNASQKGWFKAAEALVNHPSIDIKHVVDAYGATALHDAASWGHEKIVDLLLDKDATLLTIKRYSGDTPLHLAAMYGQSRIVEKLLTQAKKNGVEIINSANRDNKTPLHHAAERGEVDVVTVLLKQPAIEVNIKTTTDGYTPFHLAAKHGQLAVVKLLKDYDGVDQTVRDREGNSACTLAKNAQTVLSLNLAKTVVAVYTLEQKSELTETEKNRLGEMQGTIDKVKQSNCIKNTDYNSIIELLSCDTSNELSLNDDTDGCG